MYARVLPVVILLATVASSCGRIGYDEIASLGGPTHSVADATGGTSSGPDGSVHGGGRSGSGSGGASGSSGSGSGGAGAAVGTGGAQGGSGGATSSGGALGRGGADAAAGNGGASDGGGATGSGGAAGRGGTIGSGGAVADAAAGTGGGVFGDAGIVGCADGQREGFLDLVTYPAIAACAGGFALPGVVGLSGPACGHDAGDDSANPNGSGCNALDLCAAGFHLCSSAAEVALQSSTGCVGAAGGATPEFFVTAQPGAGSRACGATGADDLFGCGTLGTRPVNGSNCTPLDRWSANLCSALVAPWSCGSDQAAEASNVVKAGPAGGGVLCCRD